VEVAASAAAAGPVTENGTGRGAGVSRLPDNDRPLPEVRGADEPGYVHRSRENPSPIGSADNPIVLLDRADSTPSRDNDR
jgi:hypothetical protein